MCSNRKHQNVIHEMYRCISTFFLITTISKVVTIYSKALHWVPIPMPMPMSTHAHGFWVGMGAILLFMGGHGWA